MDKKKIKPAKTEIASSENNSLDKDDSRRSLLKKLAVGGIAGAAMPAQWSRPVIDTVILPAHAQTSDTTIRGGGGGGGAPGPAPADSLGEELLDFLTPAASAGGGGLEDVSAYCLEITVSQAGGVPTGIAVNKACINLCRKDVPGKYIQRDLESPVALVTDAGDSTKWVGNVLGFRVELTNVSTSSNALANCTYDSISGLIITNSSCNCCVDD